MIGERVANPTGFVWQQVGEASHLRAPSRRGDVPLMRSDDLEHSLPLDRPDGIELTEGWHRIAKKVIVKISGQLARRSDFHFCGYRHYFLVR